MIIYYLECVQCGKRYDFYDYVESKQAFEHQKLYHNFKAFYKEGGAEKSSLVYLPPPKPIILTTPVIYRKDPNWEAGRLAVSNEEKSKKNLSKEMDIDVTKIMGTVAETLSDSMISQSTILKESQMAGKSLIHTFKTISYYVKNAITKKLISRILHKRK